MSYLQLLDKATYEFMSSQERILRPENQQTIGAIDAFLDAVGRFNGQMTFREAETTTSHTCTAKFKSTEAVLRIIYSGGVYRAKVELPSDGRLVSAKCNGGGLVKKIVEHLEGNGTQRKTRKIPIISGSGDDAGPYDHFEEEFR